MKILYVTTVSNTVNAFLIPHIKILVSQRHQVDVAFNIDQEIKQEIHDMGCNVYAIPFHRDPFNIRNIKAYLLLKKVIERENYDFVHTHTPVASVCTRLICRKIKNIKVLYTAHGFHFFKGAPLKNWLIYSPIEKFLAKYTDILITINNEDYLRAKKFLKAGRVEYIPGVGLDTHKFCEIEINKSEKRKQLGLPKNAFVVLSIGELNRNKNHETIIRAISKLNNPDIHYMICGKGPLERYLKNLSSKLGIEKQVHLLGFRKDIPEICKSSDIFAFPSRREGLGLAALEAMASGLPIITSNIHGIADYSIDGKTGYTCSPMNINGFANKIELLLQDNDLRTRTLCVRIDVVWMV